MDTIADALAHAANDSPGRGLFIYRYAWTDFPRPKPEAIESIEMTEIEPLAVRAYLQRLVAVLHRVSETKHTATDGVVTMRWMSAVDLRLIDLDVFVGPKVFPVLQKHAVADDHDQLWITVRGAKPGDVAYGFWFAPLSLLEL